MMGYTIIIGWISGLIVILYMLGKIGRHQNVRNRIFSPVGNDVTGPVEPASDSTGPLQNWLALAGYRRSGSVGIYLALQACAGIVGIGIISIATLSGIVTVGSTALGRLPGGIGDLFLPILYAGPWILGVIILVIPWLVVRAIRRERVTQIEQDLSLFLEMLATLSEAGLAFDAALDRILSAQPAYRPLTEEFRIFQRDVLAGVPRVRALRQVATRADVLSLTILISALVQAEQVGSGLAEVLRCQADDLRGRRRERALTLANALPVKLMFPLVICFLPGLFVATLGPTFFEFFKFADTVIRSRSLR